MDYRKLKPHPLAALFPAYVISASLKRRHLDVGQRAMIAAELATMRQGERTDKNLPQKWRKVHKGGG